MIVFPDFPPIVKSARSKTSQSLAQKHLAYSFFFLLVDLLPAHGLSFLSTPCSLISLFFVVFSAVNLSLLAGSLLVYLSLFSLFLCFRRNLAVSEIYLKLSRFLLLCSDFSYSAALSVVEIDLLTGETQVISSDIIFDGGVTVNPDVDIGQIEGCFVMV